MHIVFVSAPLANPHAQAPSAMAEQAIRQLSEIHPHHEWTILQGLPLPGPLSFLKKKQNIREIRELKPDLLLYASPDNLQPVDNIPVMVLVTGPVAKPKDHWKKSLPFIKTIITDTEWMRKQLITSYNLEDEQVKLLHWMEEEIEMEWPRKELTREKFTSGKEFFYYGGPIAPDGMWERLLHAFSQFKKWQQSGLQLVLAGPIDSDYRTEFQEKFEAYKYRSDVAWLSDAGIDEKKQIAAAAFALLVNDDSFAGRIAMLNAFRSSIPVIAERSRVTEELAGDAVLYADWKSSSDISQHMINLYKNEELSTGLAAKAKQRAMPFSWSRTLNELYKYCTAASEQ